MKLRDIQIGGRYIAKVSGKLVTVRVINIKRVPSASWSTHSVWRTRIEAVNEATGRSITIHSPQRLRAAVDQTQ